MKKVQFENTQKITEYEALLKALVTLSTEFRTKFNSIKPFGQSIKTTEDLHSALHSPITHYKSVIKAQMPEEEMGIPVNKDERIKSLILPNLSEVEALADEIVEKAGLNRKSGYGHTNISLPIDKILQCEGVNSVVINETEKELFFDANFRFISSSKTQAEFISLHKAFIKSFVDLKQYAIKNYGESNVKQLFNISSNTFINPVPFNMERFMDAETLDFSSTLENIVFAYPELTK